MSYSSILKLKSLKIIFFFCIYIFSNVQNDIQCVTLRCSGYIYILCCLNSGLVVARVHGDVQQRVGRSEWGIAGMHTVPYNILYSVTNPTEKKTKGEYTLYNKRIIILYECILLNSRWTLYRPIRGQTVCWFSQRRCDMHATRHHRCRRWHVYIGTCKQVCISIEV